MRASGYELKVPKGTAATLEARLTDSEPTERTALNWYTVRSGESLLTIARKLRVSKADLAEANYLSATARVAPGQRLVIPRAPASLLAARPDRPVPLAESRQIAPASDFASNAPETGPSPQARLIYKVKRGDTLGSIANLFKTSVASLRKWNGLRTSHIAPGDRLTIFSSVTRTAQNR